MNEIFGLSTLDLSRFQFATTSIFHYFFVAFTVGFSLIIAVLQTLAHRSGDPKLENLTRFFGHLFFINFAVGVVTGIVQEFQFGMNWQSFSNFVGNIFGVPLALEVLMAFFLESTFLGLWWFGKGRLPAWASLASIWIVAVGTTISAFWIIIANAWMQHPVGYTLKNGRAIMTDAWAVVTNPKGLEWFAHLWTGSLTVAAFFVLAVSAYHLRRRHNVSAFTISFKVALVAALVGSVGVTAAGHVQGQSAVRDQPMKYAAFSALWNTPEGSTMPESLVALPSNAERDNRFEISVPYLGSFLAFNNLHEKARGLNQLQAEYTARYGPGNYIPYVWPVYWAFRVMVGLGGVMLLVSLYYMWRWRMGRLDRPGRLYPLLLVMPLAPHLANFSGWIATEMGRQPWVVQGLLRTADAVSALSPLTVLLSLVAFWLVYLTLIGLDVFLLTRTARAGMHDPDVETPSVPAPVYLPEGAAP
ncbi:cytochrome d ubiquinol oxidase subunit I [Deinococcus metalli]|uniref:Cytochrome d ubiquinol oxidase subunit I n=1 Tax=Deinococcus metalli TaxID=1141878 RepID=A0A7W8KEH9_9DEIO|nr:cytochrome ubiquinol oxidase subunit I [Deinococcus metalli]MBB5376661.1 cytochrome d ubiquinol oxidase subunit I [Deinococcus metalli]GHF42427.1 cytochrome ubiquinol oxidase subunit I [Deinococcus metalli]